MKKLISTLTTATLTLASQSAIADIIKCSFTEPFVDTEYSMTQSTLTYRDLVVQTGQVIKNVSFQIVGPGKFELRAKDGKVLQKLELSMNGTDGMSDNVYPYEVIDTTGRAGGGDRGAYGGCTSNLLKSTNPHE